MRRWYKHSMADPAFFPSAIRSVIGTVNINGSFKNNELETSNKRYSGILVQRDSHLIIGLIQNIIFPVAPSTELHVLLDHRSLFSRFLIFII